MSDIIHGKKSNITKITKIHVHNIICYTSYYIIYVYSFYCFFRNCNTRLPTKQVNLVLVFAHSPNSCTIYTLCIYRFKRNFIYRYLYTQFNTTVVAHDPRKRKIEYLGNKPRYKTRRLGFSSKYHDSSN